MEEIVDNLDVRKCLDTSKKMLPVLMLILNALLVSNKKLHEAFKLYMSGLQSFTLV